jgi:polysaccharide biosynthesis protein PslH
MRYPMKVLHVMSEFPYPPDNGIRADIWGRLRAMNRLGYSIDILVMRQKLIPEERHVAEMRGLVNSLQFVERRPLRKCLATIIPTAIARNKALAELPLCRQYNLTLAEGDDTLPIFANPWLQSKLHVLRVHDDQSAWMWAAAKSEENLLRRQFCRLEAMRFALFSRPAYRRVDSLWFISQSECQDYTVTQPTGAAKAVWLPASISFGEEPRRCTALSKRVLFVASFCISLNREALRWYLKEVHRGLIHDPEYELAVAGSTNGRPSAYRFAEEIKAEPRCRVHVDLEELTSLYNDCAVFINPMQRGTGVKLKNVHAIERRIPVVTTSVGNEGSGFIDKEHVRVADTPADFMSAITELLNNQGSAEQMAARAYCYLAKHYDCEANIHRLVTNLAPPIVPFADGRSGSFAYRRSYNSSG